MIRGGYGRFFDTDALEVIGGLYTGTPFTSSFVATFPVANFDNGPRTGVLPTDPFLAGGPVINRAELNRLYPGGQVLRNTGATWDSPDRRTPYTDEVTVGFERQLRPDLAVSADYVHSQARDLLMTKALNPQLRSSATVTGSTLQRVGSSTLSTALAALQDKYQGFVPFTGAVNRSSTRRDGLQRADAAAEEAFQPQLQRTCSYTYGRRTATRG